MTKYFNYETKDNYIIYYPKEIDNNKKTLVIFHCSVAGGLSLLKVIYKFKDKYNLIIPEIPGLSWNYYYDNIKNFEYYNDILIEFLDKNFKNKKINLLSHSLGGITCLKFYHAFNKNNIDKIFLVESPILPLYIYCLHCQSYDLNSVFANRLIFDIIIIPFLHKDIYVQYYINKNVNNINSVLYFDDGNNSENHIILVDKDNKIPTEFYKYYIEKNNLMEKTNLKIFNNCSHGDFLLNNEMQTYIFSKLDN